MILSFKILPHIQGDAAWTQDEDFGYFNFDFTAFESDIEDGDLDLTWSISGIDLQPFHRRQRKFDR